MTEEDKDKPDRIDVAPELKKFAEEQERKQREIEEQRRIERERQIELEDKRRGDKK